MSEDHPNVEVVKRFDPTDLGRAEELFSEDAVFHFFNAALPDLQGDHVGPAGIRSLFERLGERTGDTFTVDPVSIAAAGDELVVVRSVNGLTMGETRIEVDVVVVWRIENGRIAEVWDIPAVRSARTAPVEGA